MHAPDASEVSRSAVMIMVMRNNHAVMCMHDIVSCTQSRDEISEWDTHNEIITLLIEAARMREHN